ncbi:MAG TPA: HAMP domain-containing sensor histidine kinase [Terriglobales bacterium]|nr:HAMP domain-containing sensor histidine kinase [Terriglobales bacterium]
MLVAVAASACALVGMVDYRLSRAAANEHTRQMLSLAAEGRRQLLFDRLTRERDQVRHTLESAESNCGASGALNTQCVRESLAEYVRNSDAICALLVTPGRLRIGAGGCARWLATLADSDAGLQFVPSASQHRVGYVLRTRDAEGRTRLLAGFYRADLQQIFSTYGLGRSGHVDFVSPTGQVFAPHSTRPNASCHVAPVSDGHLRTVLDLPEIGGCLIAEIEQAEALAGTAQLRRVSMGLAALWGLAALALAYVVAGLFSTPIAQLRRRALALQAGDFDSPVPRGGPMEIREFGQVFADMASSLKRSRAQLRDRERADASSKLAASLAHEINNPLAAVTYALALLARSPGLDPRSQTLLDVAREEAARMTRISRQLLGLYPTGALAQVDVSRLVAGALEEHGPAMRQAGLRVQRKLMPGCEIACFEQELHHALLNLLRNATGAARHGDCIWVHVYRSRDWRDPRRKGVRIVLRDTGPGIARDRLNRLLAPFSPLRTERGSGLGIWVVRAAVEKHGGRIRVRSATKGAHGGTCVSIFLPENPREQAVA